MNVSDLREILQYVPRFRERVFVIAIDGEVAASDNFPNILLDLAVLRSLSIKVVLVHGAAHQISELAAARGVKLSNADGTGVTDTATLQVSIDAAIRLTNEIMEGLSAVDLRAAYINAMIAHPAGILGGVDQQYTGRVERVDVKALKLLLDEGICPIIPPLGFDGEGRTFRVNSDAAAVEVAEELGASKIIYLAPHSAFTGESLPRQVSVAETNDLLKRRKDDLAPSIWSKLDCAARACVQGVLRVHVLDGSVNEALLTEIFSHEGFGTMVYSNEYQQIRRIFKKDVRAVMSLIRQSVKNEELVRRTRTEITEKIEDYWLLEVDRTPVACVALHVYHEDASGELACLYVSKAHENQGYGRKLMAFVENIAREKGLRRIFALSTQAVHYLQQKGGFIEVPPEKLPAMRRIKYETSGRNSRVLEKTLSA
ncbi:MAG: amino-acid N-acetyltransferase [Verrucomicrobia bacterium 61-8]|mgnify:CR=1 FL=1|nr:amino-acid N-acetyltransferase [Verrucomicrobiota bacterium]OJU97846.1 MAG: amino-acid N-acetyltransferase [Verrucomicrobia bacterium 61-8]